jgi:glucosamine--fructose-6-phosphate aminotransferase (isomerizing)
VFALQIKDSDMCGIVAYVGNRQVAPLLIEGLKRLEYRGYDSAGLAVMSEKGLTIGKSVGRVSVLENKIQTLGDFSGSLGIAHTRCTMASSKTMPRSAAI